MSTIKPEEVTAIADQIAAHGISALFRVIAQLERKLEFVSAFVLRSDVESIYKEMWDSEGHEPKDMTEEEWARFKQEWFWRKGFSEVMWENVDQAIRMDLRDLGLTPEEALID